METRRSEEAGHTKKMLSATTAALVLCPELPDTGLKQSMHDPTIPLEYMDIAAASLAGSEVDLDISKSLIADAIKRIHTLGVNQVFRGNNCNRYPVFPTVSRIPVQKTEFWQFGAIFEDEGTIEGTYDVHKNIFLTQLGLRAPAGPTSQNDDFRERLFLVHGDQLTAHHIRSVQREQTHASLSYDRRQWLLGVPAWFHIQMNLLNTIVRTHWASPNDEEEAHHTIQADVTMWGRSQTSRDNAKYHLMEPIVAQGFTARVTALFYAAMRRRGHLPESNSNSLERIEFVNDAIGLLSPDQFLQLVEDVRVVALTGEAWSIDRPDVEFRTMCRMLREVELFLTVRHAIKYGDIGLLRHLVGPLVVFFFGAAQYNYGYEMLYYYWCLSKVNTPEL
jgi:hypothetical protein